MELILCFTFATKIAYIFSINGSKLNNDQTHEKLLLSHLHCREMNELNNLSLFSEQQFSVKNITALL